MKKILVVDDSPAWRSFHKKNIDEIFIELDTDKYKLDCAISAKDGYDHLMQNNDEPYDVIITDLQMEEDFAPKYAGEWFVEQIKNFNNYYKTRIIIISGCYNIKHISELYNVDYIPKNVAVNDINGYKDFIIKSLN